MEPNLQQKQWLKEYLRSVLTYRETYEEVYDHVLLALENRPADRFFESSVNAVIEDDFGGSNGLMKLEENCKSGVVHEITKQYRSAFTKWLTSLSAIYTILFAVAIYYICGHVRYSGLYVFAAFLFMILTPVFLLPIRRFKNGYKFGDIKASAKDSIFRSIAYLPFRILLYLTAFESIFNLILYRVFLFHQKHPDHRTDGNITKVNFSVTLIAIFILSIIHIISFYKIYKNEFKISIIK